MRSQHTPIRRERGSTLLEVILPTAVLLPIFVGAFQLGHAFFAYNALSAQIRTGARYASKRTFRCADSVSIAKYKTAVANMVRFGNPDGSGVLLEPGLQPNQIDVRLKDAAGAPAGPANPPVSVSVSIANFTVELFGTVDLSRKPILEFPFVGQYAPDESELRTDGPTP
jgi:hypothetical protein